MTCLMLNTKSYKKNNVPFDWPAMFFLAVVLSFVTCQWHLMNIFLHYELSKAKSIETNFAYEMVLSISESANTLMYVSV